MSRDGLRFAGREPSWSREISSTGVAAWKNADEARVAVDEVAVDLGGAPRHLGHHLAVALQPLRVRAGGGLQRADQHGAAGELELAVGDLGERELGREHLALLGHLHAARDRAGRLRVDRAVGGAAAAAERAAAAVEEDPRDAVALELLGERDLGAVGRPARRDVARVLVGVRVADHHLLLVADRAQRGAVDGQLEQRAHRLGRLLERVLGLEQRDDPQPRALAARLGQPALLHQQQHLEQVGRLLGAGDDVGLDGAGVAAAEQLAERAERADDLLRLGRQPAQIRRDQRPPLRDLARQQRAALRGRERRVGLVDAERGQHLGDRRAVAAGVLADVEAGEVEAEHLDLADRVVQLRGGDELPLARPQRALGRAQVGEQLRG